MPAKPLALAEDISLSEVEAALELSAMDPDRPLTARHRNILKRCAIGGALTGLEHGGPALPASGEVLTVVSAYPESAVEVGSDSHADFVH